MNDLKLTSSGAGSGAAHNAGNTARVAVHTAAPQRDVAPNLDTGVLFVGDAGPGPAPSPQRQDALAPFAGLVGARLGPANPAWRQDGLGLLRNLQKRLITHALTLPEGARRPGLDAVTVLESAVTLRLRIMQMQLDDFNGGPRHSRSPDDIATGDRS